MTIFVGTSGWQYADWRGSFYPAGLGQTRWLQHYARSFATVELNAAFYRPIKRATFEGWRERTPGDFVMAVKASRVLAHFRRLRDIELPLERMLEAAAGLGNKLGPILFQFPPDFPVTADRLGELLRLIPADLRVAVEPRHPSWWADDTARGVLEARNVAWCWADRLDRPVLPLWRTSDWGYMRFHEGTALPRPRYTEAVLADRLRDITAAWGPGEDVYVYFNNDPGGAAIHDAIRFAELAVGAGYPVSRAVEGAPSS